MPGRVQTTPLPPTQRPTFQPSKQLGGVQSNFVGGSDLKTSSSQDSRRTQNENVFESDEKPSLQKTTPKPLIIEFQPPFLHPIYNLIDTAAATTRSPQFARPLPTTTSVPELIQTTINSITEQRKPGASEERVRARPSSSASSGVSNFGDRLQTSTSPSITTPPTVVDGTLVPVINDNGKVKQPPTVLLPPYESLNLYGGASTQGPPIYHEWKFPASNLEPPFDENKSNGAITITSEENQIPVIPPQTTTKPAGSSFLEKDLVPPLFDNTNINTNTNIKLPTLSLQPPAYSPLHVFNDSVQASSNHSFPSFNALHNSFSQSTDKSQTQRSVSTTPAAVNTIPTQRTTTRKELNYLDLKKQFSVPEYTFPLENIERPSYTESNAVNSFQIKIPDEVSHSREVIADGTSNEVQRKPWYGENVNCPECHPSFLKPGSCEPCIKIR